MVLINVDSKVGMNLIVKEIIKISDYIYVVVNNYNNYIYINHIFINFFINFKSGYGLFKVD